MPSVHTEPLFAAARRLGIGFCLGYAERVVVGGRVRRFNSSVLVAPSGRIVGRYRKIHLPGHADHRPTWPTQHLEKRYFETGDLGFRVDRVFGGWIGMAICNDRRWPETYRVLGLQGVEMVLIGYNTPAVDAEAPELDRLASFHNRLVMQSGAYQNGTWVVGVAKAGCEEGVQHIGDSVIIAPSGEVMACTTTLDDELTVAPCDLDATRIYKTTIFDFARHREPGAYRLIADRRGAGPPAN